MWKQEKGEIGETAVTVELVAEQEAAEAVAEQVVAAAVAVGVVAVGVVAVAPRHRHSHLTPRHPRPASHTLSPCHFVTPSFPFLVSCLVPRVSPLRRRFLRRGLHSHEIFHEAPCILLQQLINTL